MNGLIQDVRFALRQLRKTPGFTAVAVITLALGIGANTAIFSVVNGVLLRPLEFPHPDQLVRVWHVPPPASFPGMTTFSVSAANYLDWKRQNHVFDAMAIYGYHGFTLTGGDKPEQVDACAATSGFFSTLGVQPMLGRVFLPGEDQPGHSNVVVLSHRLWQEHFGSNPDIVGHDIQMDGQSYLVAGVMPANFQFPDFAQMWTPMAWTDKEKAVRGEHHSVVVARLKPGVDLKQAQAEMNTISSRLAQQYPDDDKGWGAVVVPLHQDMVSDVRPALLVLLGAVAFVLLIASVNVANLALARTFARQKEIAIRTALGASSTRVLRQILTESVLLALIGGALGLTWAHAGIRLITAFLAEIASGDGSWIPVGVLVAPVETNSTRIRFALVGQTERSFPRTPDRVQELELRLRQIGAELRAAGVLDSMEVAPAPDDYPQMGQLTSRQWEILSRLLQGERVSTIAKALFVSQSTVRNHLSTIFRKFDVHNQAELIEHFRPKGR